MDAKHGRHQSIDIILSAKNKTPKAAQKTKKIGMLDAILMLAPFSQPLNLEIYTPQLNVSMATNRPAYQAPLSARRAWGLGFLAPSPAGPSSARSGASQSPRRVAYARDRERSPGTPTPKRQRGSL